MNEQDQTVIGTGILTAVAAGLWMQFIGIGVGVSTFIDFLQIITLIGAAVTAYKASTAANSSIGRNLTLIGIGMALYVFTYWTGYILTYWTGYSWAAAGTPPILGIGTHVWHLFFNTLTFTAAAVVAYGLYLFFEAESGE